MNKIMKVVNVVAFVILLIGGMNYLIAGLFGVDLMMLLFGTNISVVGRIAYSIIGLSSLLLLVTVIARTVIKNKKNA
ncbi:MAG: DUF378 domain-containing protein [Clostridia bacterium]|nr:DUF378 domain-containing protein [Clostridia bacterium]